jgi:hypothetical protein
MVPRVGQIKDYEIGICCCSTKHTSLKKNGKEWLARNQDTVSRVGLFADCCIVTPPMWSLSTRNDCSQWEVISDDKIFLIILLDRMIHY